MVRAEPTNTRTTDIDTYHSTRFTLLLELNVICGKRWIQFEWQNSLSRAFALMAKLHCHLANLWNRITTKIFDTFRIITSKQKIFSQSDPVLIRQPSKILQSDPVLVRPKLASVLIQSDPVLISAHLCWTDPDGMRSRRQADNLTRLCSNVLTPAGLESWNLDPVHECWTWSGFRIAIQVDSSIQNRIRIGLDFEKTCPDRIWIFKSKLQWSLQ